MKINIYFYLFFHLPPPLTPHQTLLPALLTVTLDPTTRLSVLDLSLAPSLHPTSCRRAQFYTDISAALGFPYFKVNSNLLKKIFVHIIIRDVFQEL